MGTSTECMHEEPRSYQAIALGDTLQLPLLHKVSEAGPVREGGREVGRAGERERMGGEITSGQPNMG